jgi:hypothetical protein
VVDDGGRMDGWMGEWAGRQAQFFLISPAPASSRKNGSRPAAAPVRAFPFSIFRDKNRCTIGISQPKWTAKNGNACSTLAPPRAPILMSSSPPPDSVSAPIADRARSGPRSTGRSWVRHHDQPRRRRRRRRWRGADGRWVCGLHMSLDSHLGTAAADRERALAAAAQVVVRGHDHEGRETAAQEPLDVHHDPGAGGGAAVGRQPAAALGALALPLHA